MLHSGRALRAIVLLAVVSGLVQSGPASAEGVSSPVAGGAGIVNGIPTHLQPTTGALLFVGPDFRNQFLDCSGVLIGCRTVLTAAHCLCKTAANYAECLTELETADVADLRFFFQHSGFHHIRDIYIDPTFVKDFGGDLAVLRLSQLVEGIEPAVIHKSFPTFIPSGTDGIIAGFGNSGDGRPDAGIKRVGAIEVGTCPIEDLLFEPENICWDFTAPILKPGDEANLCLADDGGPLFIDFGNGPEVTGIHAGGGVSCDVDSYSYSTNVRKSSDWIEQVGGLDIKRDQCSTFGEVGEPWVIVQGGSGTLPRSQDEKFFAFDIPKDALRVRVTVNGDTEKGGDYDLFVGLDTKIPTRFDNDCQSRGTGQFGVCNFEDPDFRRVNVVIRHVRPKVGKGKSRFQVTVTAWMEVPPIEDPPRGPDNLSYRRRASGLRELSWIDDSNNEKGFELQRRAGINPENPFSTRATIPAGRQTYLETIANDTPFTYRIRAFNDFGNSVWSNLCVVNFRLKRPTRLRVVESSPDDVLLAWRDNSVGEDEFELQRRVSGETKWRVVKRVPAGTTQYLDRGVEAGENYEYRIRGRGFPDECVKHSAFSGILEVSVPLL